MEIRHSSPQDSLREISDVYERSWKYAYENIIPQHFLDSIPSGQWANGIFKDNTVNLVALAEGHIVGTLCYGKSRWPEFADCGEIISVYLLPEYMGKGCGKRLMETAIEELRALKFQTVLLWVLEENFRARRFYEKCGFTFCGESKQADFGGKELSEMLYILRLN